MTNTADFYLSSIDPTLFDEYDRRVQRVIDQVTTAERETFAGVVEAAANLGIHLLGSRALHDIVLSMLQSVGEADVETAINILYDRHDLDVSPAVRRLLDLPA